MLAKTSAFPSYAARAADVKASIERGFSAGACACARVQRWHDNRSNTQVLLILLMLLLGLLVAGSWFLVVRFSCCC